MTLWAKLFPAKQRLRRFTESVQQLEERRLLSGTPVVIADGNFNDSIASATVLGTTTTLRPGNWQVNGNVGIGTDRFDYYRFELHERSTVSISLSNLRANMQVELLGSAGHPIKVSNKVGTQSELISTTLDKGVYQIRVSSGGIRTLSSSYRLNVTTELALKSDADESNNTLATATDIGSVSAINQTLSNTRTNRNIGFSGDVNDYYKFTVSNLTRASGTVTLTGMFGNANLQVLNSAGKVVAQSSLTGSNSESVTLTSLNPGTYYIRVLPGQTGAATAYNLTVNLSADANSDFNGNNNNNTDAINLGSVTTKPLIKTTSDSIGANGDTSDLYKFDVAPGRKSKFTLELSILKGVPSNLNLELVDALGNVIPLTQTVKGNQRSITLSDSAARLASGSYFIRFTSTAGANIDYRFLINAQTQLA
jgi:hypothetical protein